MEGRQHLVWINVLKGIGIFSVVLGHVWSPSSFFVNLYHMPLFFFVSGYLYRPLDARQFVFKKIHSLLIPYFSFLLTLYLVSNISTIYEFFMGNLSVDFGALARDIYYKFYGGRVLTVWFGVFWFITCLFVTQQLYNIIRLKIKSETTIHVIVLVCYVLALLNDIFLPDYKFFWNINVTALAIVFFHLGYLFKRWELLENNKLNKLMLVFSVFIILSAIVLENLTVLDLSFEMVYSNYGIPVFSPLLAMSILIGMIWCVKAIINLKTEPLILLGEASLVIMLVHQPIHYTLRNNNITVNGLILLVSCIAVSLAIYFLLKKIGFFSRWYLGRATV